MIYSGFPDRLQQHLNGSLGLWARRLWCMILALAWEMPNGLNCTELLASVNTFAWNITRLGLVATQIRPSVEVVHSGCWIRSSLTWSLVLELPSIIG